MLFSSQKLQARLEYMVFALSTSCHYLVANSNKLIKLNNPANILFYNFLNIDFYKSILDNLLNRLFFKLVV